MSVKGKHTQKTWKPNNTPPLTHLLIVKRGRERSVFQLKDELKVVVLRVPGDWEFPGDRHPRLLTLLLLDHHV